jgi:hypothetical protein
LYTEKIADCALARNGRPAAMFGFHSGMSGRRSLVYWTNDWSCPGASPSSVLLGISSSAGFTPAQGGSNQSVSEFESVLPGSSAGPTNTSASAA